MRAAAVADGGGGKKPRLGGGGAPEDIAAAEAAVPDRVIDRANRVQLTDGTIRRLAPGAAAMTVQEAADAGMAGALGAVGAAALLYLTTGPTNGHWVGVLRHGDGSYEYFDPLGGGVDAPCAWVAPATLASWGQRPAPGAALLNGCGPRLAVNRTRFEAASDMDTCGRWVGLRIHFRSRKLRAFKAMLDQALAIARAADPEVTYDDLVTAYTMVALGAPGAPES